MPPFSKLFPAPLLALALALVSASPAQPATASEPEVPFNLRFPQEIEETRFTDSWGATRSGGRRHKGADLMADRMTEVYAVAEGVVTRIASSPRAGRYVVVEHAGGWESYYIHLNNDTPGTDDGNAPWHLTIAPGLEEGSELAAGQILGWVGDSGNAEGTSPHTHFELRHAGRSLNPYPMLIEAYERDRADLIRRRLLRNQFSGDPSML